MGALFLPWSAANAAAIAAGDEEFTVSLKGNDWTQKPQKYHARSLAALKAKYDAAKDTPGLREVLGRDQLSGSAGEGAEGDALCGVPFRMHFFRFARS